MKTLQLTLFATGLILAAAANSHSATLVQGEFQVIGDTNLVGQPSNPGISVTSGSEGYSTGTDGLGTGGLDGTFNGAILDYAFYTSGTGSLVESIGGAASLINTPTIPGGSTSSDVANSIDIWAGSPTSGTADQLTWSRPVDVNGTVDISGLASGSFYMFFGTRVGTGDKYGITFSLTGSGQTPVNLSEVDINTTSQGGTANNTWFVYRADFADAAAYDTLTYSYDMTSGNTAARSRYAGVVVTGIPEPSSMALLGVAGLALAGRRRRA